VILLFFFYFKGKDLTWRFLQKGVVERSVMPLLPPDYSAQERKEIQRIFDDFFDDLRKERIDQARGKTVIDDLSRMTEDRRLDRQELERLLKEIREAKGR
jgi:cytochrome P450